MYIAVALCLPRQSSNECSFNLSTGPPAGSVCISPKARPSFAVYYPLLYGRPVSSHSPLLLDVNPRRCVLNPSAREGEEQKAQGRVTVE
jgi:hypothetical protein